MEVFASPMETTTTTTATRISAHHLTLLPEFPPYLSKEVIKKLNLRSNNLDNLKPDPTMVIYKKFCFFKNNVFLKNF